MEELLTSGIQLDTAPVPAGYLSFMAVALAFAGAGILTSALLSRKHSGGDATAYESGEQPTGTPWVPFQARFYVLALIFLLFEIEIAFLFPYALGGIRAMPKAVALAEGTLFIGILALGLAYAWLSGLLDWPGYKKANPQPPFGNGPVPKEAYNSVYKEAASVANPTR